MRNLKAVLGAGLSVVLASGCGPELAQDVRPESQETGSVSQGLNVITNGSFESAPAIASGCSGGITGSSAFAGWTLSGSVTLMAPACKTPANGSRSIKFNYGNMTQNMPTVVGGGYTVQFAFSTSPGCGSSTTYLDMTVDGRSYNFSTASASWQYRTVVFNALTSSTPIVFKNLYTSQPCGVAIDDVTVTGP